MPRPDAVQESVTVERVVVSARPLDKFSRPLLGLGPTDFEVSVDGVEVGLESAEWIGETGDENNGSEGPVSESSSPLEVSRPRAPSGRQMVLLFQWEIAAQKAVGFIRMQRQAKDFVSRVRSEDRIAVVLYDSRLWIRQDFTSDRSCLTETIENVLAHEEDRVALEALPPSLADSLPESRARTTSSMGEALVVLGQALEGIPGEKELLVFGWGVDTWRQTDLQLLGRPRISQDYELARRSLESSGTVLFAIDVSDGFHRLGQGFPRIALETGGFWVPSHDFPEVAMRSVEQSLAGHYELVFRKPARPRGRHEIRVALVGGQGTVYHRRFYDDGGQP